MSALLKTAYFFTVTLERFFYAVLTNVGNKKRRAISPACPAYILFFVLPESFIIRVTILSV